MKTLTLLVVAAFTCTSALATTIDGIEPELNYEATEATKSTFFMSEYIDVKIENYSFPRGKQRAKFEMALDLLDDVLNSEEFKKRVIGYYRIVDGEKVHSYQKNYLWKDSTKRLSNEDVYYILMEGNEKMRPDTYGEMNINAKVKKCSRWKSWHTWCRAVVGSTAPYKSKWITVNWKFYHKYEVNNMVANLVHEWIHLLGFLHGNDRMREEVPYVVGSIAGQIAQEILEEGKILNRVN